MPSSSRSARAFAAAPARAGGCRAAARRRRRARAPARRRAPRATRSSSLAARAWASGSSSRSTRSSLPPATRASERASFSESPGARSARSSRMTRLGQAPERHELAARADRRRERPELVGDEDDHGVRRRLLEVLQQRVGRVVVQQVCVGDHVDAPVGLVRAHVQVAVERADLVDPDHLAERLEREEVGMRPGLDAALVAEQGGGEARARPRACRHPPGRGRGTRAPAPPSPPRRAGAAPPAAQAGRRSSPGSWSASVSGSSDAVEEDDPLRKQRRQPLVARGDLARGRPRPRARSGRACSRRASSDVPGSIASTNVRSGSSPPMASRLSSSTSSSPSPRADALVDDRAVEVAVEQDVGAAGERGPHHLGDELGAGGGVEERLRPRRHRAAVQDEVPDRLAERGAAGLAGGHDLAALRLERRPQRAPPGSSCRSRRFPRRSRTCDP